MAKVEFVRSYWNEIIANDNDGPNKYDQTFLNKSNGLIECFICKEELPETLEDTNDAKIHHRMSKRHLQVICAVKHHSILFDNTKNNWQLICRICTRPLRKRERILDHIKNVEHRQWLDKMEDLIIVESELVSASSVSIDSFLKCESDFAHCRMCDLDIECTLKGVAEHTASAAHKKEFLEVLKPCSGLFAIENGKIMWCKVCDLRLDNNVDEVLHHLTESEAHGRWFHDIDIMCQQDISMMDYITEVSEMKVYCCRCELKIKADLKNIIVHVQSEPHRYRHMNPSLAAMRSLADQNIWPPWCYWNFFNQTALSDRGWPA